MEISTCAYIRTHGRLPRQSGPKSVGAWAFSTKQNPEPSEVFITPPIKYSDAKKLAVEKFGKVMIYVLP